MTSSHDRQVLRDLAARVRDIAMLDEMEPRRQRWRDHNALRGERPMVLAFPENAWGELIPADTMQCEDKRLGGWERRLRTRVYWWDHIHDDFAEEPIFTVQSRIDRGNYGVEVPHTKTEDLGSYVWDSPIKDVDKDFDELQHRQMSYDAQATQRDMELANELFGDLLTIEESGLGWWGVARTWDAAHFVGLEQLMMLMYDNPDGLHRIMAFLRDDDLNMMLWAEREGLLRQTNRNSYVGSGGVAYTDELPQPDYVEGQPVRLIDRWGFGESQETVGISPQMFAEFIMPYQAPLLEKFGLNCYGCCEPVHTRIDIIMENVPRLRRVSAAPMVDQQVLKEKIGNQIIFSRKPNPVLICNMFDEDMIRADLRKTLAIAGAGPLEFIMKDTHTVQNEPWRITRWVEIALEEVERFAGAGV